MSRKWVTFESLKNLNVRIQTFRDWPLSFIAPEDLARAGFFYLKKLDYVECAFCRGVVAQWEVGDDPWKEHKKHFKWCPFVNGLPVGNVEDPIDEEAYELDPSYLEHNDARPRYISERRPNSAPERSGFRANVQSRYPEYSSIDLREKSFKDWPHEQTPKEMAEAGFFYSGLSDHGKCFFCGGGLRNFTNGDDPWREHAYWYFRCRYVRNIKGIEYVKSVRGKDDMPNPPFISWEDCINSIVVNKLQDLGFEMSKIREVVMKRLVEDCYTIPSLDSVAELLLDEEDQAEELDEIRTLLRESDIELQPETTTTNLNEIRTLLRESDKDLEPSTNLNDESGLCCICLDETVGVVFLPCRHMCGTRCALKLTEKNCHICRAVIRYQIKVFL